jgi:Protein of unknown function (DUF642)/PEP-CTERM motif
MKRILSGVLAVLAANASAYGATNLLSDGGFEQPVVPAGAFTNELSAATFDGWTVVGAAGGVSIVSGTFSQNGISFVSEQGAQWLDLTGDGTNSSEGVAQTVATVPGHTYDLSFWVGNVNNPGGIFGTTSTVDLEINGTAAGAFTNSCTSCTSVQGWQEFTTDFVASGSSTMLTFLNADPPGDNSNGLDNVVLTGAAATGVPEPATLGLLAAGLAGIGLRSRRSRRRQA